MSQQRKAKHRSGATRLNVVRAVTGKHPADVSGMFQDDPTFDDFRKILRAQRQKDYRRAKEMPRCDLGGD